MGNLEEKLNDGISSVMELAHDTLNFIPNSTIKDCFPTEVYRVVTIGNKDYQLHMTVTLREV